MGWRRRETLGRLSGKLGLGKWHELAGDCGTQEATWKSLVRIEANSGHADPEGPQGPGQEAA